jgi:hypothetical protein
MVGLLDDAFVLFEDPREQPAHLCRREARAARLDHELDAVGDRHVAAHLDPAARLGRCLGQLARHQPADALERQAALAPLLHREQLLEVRRRVVGRTGLAHRAVHEAELDVVADRARREPGGGGQLVEGETGGRVGGVHGSDNASCTGYYNCRYEQPRGSDEADGDGAKYETPDSGRSGRRRRCTLN